MIVNNFSEMALIASLQMAKDSNGEFPTTDQIRDLCEDKNIDLTLELQGQITKVYPSIRFVKH